MNEEFAIEFIRQRMCQLGIDCFHFEPLFFLDANDTITFRLDNELLYLVGLPENIEIISDTAYYFRQSPILTLTNPPEFTGDITINFLTPPPPSIVAVGAGITITPDPVLHFVRVIIQKV